VDLGDRNIISVEHAAPDHVSRFIRALAIGMIVLGTVFAVLDWCDLLPQLPAAADASSTHALVIRGMSDGAAVVRL
jgi:hypothetical protein